MPDLATIAKLPDVKSAVLGDLTGGFLDGVRQEDGETVAAVMGFVASALAQAGEQLGLGGLCRVSVTGEARATVVLVQGEAVISASVEPARSLAAVEKALDTTVHGKV